MKTSLRIVSLQFSLQVIWWFLIFSMPLCGYSQEYLHAKGTQIVNEKNTPVILRGMGLGGWMLQEGYMLHVNGIGAQQHVIRNKIEEIIGAEKTTQFYEAWLANHIRKIDIDSMAAWGFNSVRLPLHFNLFALSIDQEPVPGRQTWLETGFTLTDSLLQWCKANRMYLILDLHAAPGGQGNDVAISDRDPEKPSLWQDEANRQKAIALWRKLAERYADEPWVGAYDIINEPNWGFSDPNDRNGCGEKENAPLKKYMMDVTAAIREVDKKHIIIIEGNCWGNNYNGILPPWDNNMVLSFHKYWNYNDPSSIQNILNLRDQYAIPIWLGETGENSNLWFRDAIHLLHNNNIGYAWWPLKKLGFNNPLQIKTPPQFQLLLDYWANKAPQPSAEDAFSGLMQLAENAKLENCIYHPDVIDAMMRQPYTDKVIPFRKHQVKAGLKIIAVDYDLGRNRWAYFDLDTANYWVSSGKQQLGNIGNMYRNDGVDILKDKSGNFYISNIEPGEWLRYTLTGTKVTTYTLALTLSSKSPGGKLSISVNGKNLTVFPVSDTQGQWKTFVVGKAKFKKGENVIVIHALNGGYELQALELK